MTIGTFEEYQKRLGKMEPNIYIGGEKVGRTDERFQGGARIIKETYDRAHDPRYADICTATSHLTGEKINRFTNVHRSVDDLLKKQEMTRVLCHLCGGCIQRCMGIDAINALDVVTYEVDQATGSDHHTRFEKYLKYF